MRRLFPDRLAAAGKTVGLPLLCDFLNNIIRHADFAAPFAARFGRNFRRCIDAHFGAKP